MSELGTNRNEIRGNFQRNNYCNFGIIHTTQEPIQTVGNTEDIYAYILLNISKILGNIGGSIPPPKSLRKSVGVPRCPLLTLRHWAPPLRIINTVKHYYLEN